MTQNIHTIDLKFKGIPQTIGVYLVPHAKGAVLVECGPGSSLPNLVAALKKFDLSPKDISDVLVTHIHLDHAGSAGWWARQGARIHVHNFGAPHFLNPEKLLASAKRIYKDKMDDLWGEFLPVPEEKLNQLYDGDILRIYEREFKVIEAPGHARHHMVYVLEDTAFTGDVGGVRLPGMSAIRLPTVPPEFDLERWRSTITRLRQENIQNIAPTHFGIHPNADSHFDEIESLLDQIEAWMKRAFAQEQTQESLRALFAQWMSQKSRDAGIPTGMIGAYELAISTEMSADGMYRYWQKYRA